MYRRGRCASTACRLSGESVSARPFFSIAAPATSISNATSPTLSFGEWSTRAALSYQPTETAHYFFGYSDSFRPTADRYQLTLEPQPAETSQVFEVGEKWVLLEGDLTFRRALPCDQANTARPIPQYV